MNEKDYPTHHKTVGAFDIFKGQYMTGCYVRALADKDDHDRVKMLAHKYIELNDSWFRDNLNTNEYHQIRRRNITDKRAKKSFYEVAMTTSIKPSDVADWLAANASDVDQVDQTKDAFDAERMSVGPCRYQEKDTQYVRIRLDGYSVPLHFHVGLGSGKLEWTWDETSTTAAIKSELPNDPQTAKEIITLFKSGNTVEELIKKARTRPMNLSRIVEAGSFSPTFFVPVSYKNIQVCAPDAGFYGTKSDNFDGYKVVKNKTEMADPNLHPVAVFAFTCQPSKDKYGYARRKSLLVIVTDDDKVYTTPNVYNWYGQGDARYLNGREDARWFGDECAIRKSEFKLLDDQDLFVRERAGRALSRKL